MKNGEVRIKYKMNGEATKVTLKLNKAELESLCKVLSTTPVIPEEPVQTTMNFAPTATNMRRKKRVSLSSERKEALKRDAGKLSLIELAVKYGVSEGTVRNVLVN